MLACQPRQIIRFAGVEPHQIAARRIGQRGAGKKLFVRNRAETSDQPIFTKSLAIEEDAAAHLHRRVESLVEKAVELLRVNPEIGNTAFERRCTLKGSQ